MKLCRICGHLGKNYIHIFKTEGLKNKIETCLPIVVSPHCLLPDTICGRCSDHLDNFYSFTKNCLQNIIILESQYNIHESCLKSKRKHDKGCSTNFPSNATEIGIQTDDYLEVFLATHKEYRLDDSPPPPFFTTQPNNSPKPPLVDYAIESDSDDDVKSSIPPPATTFNKRYFDDPENILIDEIAQRKRKRENDDVTTIEFSRPKIFKIDPTTNSRRRKNRQPKKLLAENVDEEVAVTTSQQVKVEVVEEPLPLQVCLLCDGQFSGPATLASHVFETHGADMVQQIVGGGGGDLLGTDRRKKLPNLLKISDLKKSDSLEDIRQADDPPLSDNPPTLLPSFVCFLCPAVFTARPDLFTHLRVKHPVQSTLLCGICIYQANTLLDLQNHVEVCVQQHPITTRYYCQICRYGDDNSKLLENHVLVHDFLLDNCRKETKMFDPADYVATNPDHEPPSSPSKNLVCSECGQEDFESFKEFSTHRRSQHSIFHCDLCNKFYGRNSHLWKHVNRLHKGHPSITCQLCYKTSASKYHMAQHFNKIHSPKPCKQKSNNVEALTTVPESTEDFMSQKFQGFDFQSVKQSFMRQELLQQKRGDNNEVDDNSNNRLSDQEDGSLKAEPLSAPKEIDASSDLYTNIITNYTPPVNEGEFKCPKCSKGFHKKTLVKKHKKNCRPRLQKDLLTRCKSCSRIFKDRQSLAKHLVNYHSNYKCELCGVGVASKCEIVSHIRFSHPGCHLFCGICRNILRQQKDLDEHVRDHLQSFVCQFCGDALSSRIKLKMHILSLHRTILALSCGVCLKLFADQHMLRDHVRMVHRDQLAPLTSCPVCGKNYGSKWKTYDHLNKSHGRNFKACKVCLEVFDTQIQLQAHCDTHHPNVVISKNNVASSQPVTQRKGGGGGGKEVERENEEGGSGEDEEEDETEAGDEEERVEFPKFVDLDESKISLLEKRLLGKKVNDDKSQQQQPQQQNNKKNKIVEDEPECAVNSPNPQNNTSKRTVYVNSNDPSFCEVCTKVWPAKKHLWQHYIRCHKSVAATVCGICLKTNNSYNTLQRHLKQNHPHLLHGQGFGSNFICRICGRYHNASSKLRLHMVIHENFDWSLLDDNNRNPEDETNETANGYGDDDDDEEDYAAEIKQENNGDINYESLIEQVECSSSSDSETDLKDDKEDDTSSDDSDDESDSLESDNSLENHMLANMVKEKTKTTVNQTYTDSGGEESSTGTSYSNKTRNGATEEDDGSNSCTSNDAFRCKPEQLDSAIQSIKYECVETVDDDVDEDYCELQSQSLNDNEIESAVGSIL